MSTAELTGSRPRSTNGHTDPAWSDQVVLSGAGLISHGIDLTRTNAALFLGVVDDVMLGAFDTLEEWNRLTQSMTTSLTSKPVEVARRA